MRIETIRKTVSAAATAIAATLIVLALLRIANGQVPSTPQSSTITITITTPRSKAAASIQVFPAPTITEFACTPGQVLEGDTVRCSVSVSPAAPSSGYALAIMCAGTGVTCPGTIAIPAGQTSATITITAPAISALSPPPPAVNVIGKSARLYVLPTIMHSGPVGRGIGIPAVWLELAWAWLTVPTA